MSSDASHRGWDSGPLGGKMVRRRARDWAREGESHASYLHWYFCLAFLLFLTRNSHTPKIETGGESMKSREGDPSVEGGKKEGVAWKKGLIKKRG